MSGSGATATSFGGRRLFAWSALLLAGVVGLGLLHWGAKARGPKSATVAGSAAALRASCDAWDRAASEGIGALISDGSAAAELRFDEAILQLRRARKNCRAGSVALAGHDYASLHRTFPVSTGSIPVKSRRDADETARMSPP